MLIDFEPGDYVTNPANKDWGLGQVQSIIGNKVTVNFENFGKRVINVENIRPYTQLIPNAKPLILEGVGHLAMIEAPELTAQAFIKLSSAAEHTQK